MLLADRTTLVQFLIEERRRFPQASGELNAVILDVALACKAIARLVAHGALMRCSFGTAPSNLISNRWGQSLPVTNSRCPAGS